MLQALEKAPEDRKDVDLAPVVSVLQRIEVTAHFDLDVQKALARDVQYEIYYPGSIIVRQGDPGRLFYIIISGIAECLSK